MSLYDYFRSQHLQHLLDASEGIQSLASAHMQCWALTLGDYNYSIEYKPGSSPGNADGLSRIPLPDAPSKILVPNETILAMDMLTSLPIRAQQIKK